MIEVGLGRVDGDDGAVPLSDHRVAVSEELLEMDVADVARIMVPRDDDEGVRVQAVEVSLGLRVLLLEPERRQIAGADDDRGLERVDLGDHALHQVGDEMRIAAMDVRQVRDRERRRHWA